MKSLLNILFLIVLLVCPFKALAFKLASSGFLDSQTKIDETYKILKKVKNLNNMKNLIFLY